MPQVQRTAHPSAALELDRLTKLREQIECCCPPEEKPELICCYEPCVRDGGMQRGDGYSVKSKATIRPVEVSQRLPDISTTSPLFAPLMSGGQPFFSSVVVKVRNVTGSWPPGVGAPPLRKSKGFGVGAAGTICPTKGPIATVGKSSSST